MKNFLKNLTNTLNEEANISVTENGALGYRSSGKNLLDLNFKVSSYRNATVKEITDDFYKAFWDNRLLTLKWLFFARDIRGGLGERRLFRIIFEDLAHYHEPKYILKAIPLIAEYGRYDDLFVILDKSYIGHTRRYAVLNYLKETFFKDLQDMEQGRPVTLLAKWLPSCNASSAKTKKLAEIIRKSFRLGEKDYRKKLSALRKYIDVTEVKTCANKWGEIDYKKVPSKANLLYGRAFFKHDKARREAFLNRVLQGEEKINSSVLYPHDIVYKYMVENYGRTKDYDKNLEALWQGLSENFTLGDKAKSTIVVADGSGSMYTPVSAGSGVTALDVANALAIYFAQGLAGEFKNKYITFSERPQLVDLNKGGNLKEKIEIALTHNECANTNIEAVFDLILTTAVNNKLKQEDFPANILVISDMEFDYAAEGPADERLFTTLAKRYGAAGYKLPRLIFWNVCGRSGTIPLKENANGLVLVSGFSPNIAKMIMDNELDPYKCLVNILEGPRYDKVHNAFCRKKSLRPVRD